MIALTLTEVLVDRAGTPIPVEAFAPVMADNWDRTLFLGHIDEDEIVRRLRIVETPNSGALTLQGNVDRDWVVFERHIEGCSEADFEVCDCAEEDWYANPAKADTAGAVAVTYALCDGTWDE